MREAFGGSWLLGFVALFIVLFSAYLAVSINYTKAFKAKNKIINIIEQNEGMSKSVGDVRNKTDEELNKGKTTEDKIYYYLKQAGFVIDKDTLSGRCPDDTDDTTLYAGGYCVKGISTREGKYYKVTTFVKIELPVIWVNITVPVKGETKVIYHINE